MTPTNVFWNSTASRAIEITIEKGMGEHMARQKL